MRKARRQNEAMKGENRSMLVNSESTRSHWEDKKDGDK